MRILGIDPGLARVGYGVIDTSGGHQRMLDCGIIRTDPDGFSTAVEANQDALQQRVVEAQQRLSAVTIDDDLRLRISAVCGELDVDGLRGDIVTNRAARALAAFESRTEVSEEDVARVASCCLRHRLRKDPLEQVDSGDRVVKVFCKVFERSESSDRADFELALAA